MKASQQDEAIEALVGESWERENEGKSKKHKMMKYTADPAWPGLSAGLAGAGIVGWSLSEVWSLRRRQGRGRSEVLHK